MNQSDINILAYYLPQFHEIEENNMWWGKGYTEWKNARAAKPMYRGHYQPREPLNDNYYDLLNPAALAWQAKLAKKYGIDGFCIYHYWFEGRKILEKPVELLLEHKEIDIPFCFTWANHSWSKTWEGPGGEKKVLLRQTYGDINDWRNHFNYMLPFFKDSRYILKDNKPIFLIYMIDDIKHYEQMMECWNSMAVENGFAGIYCIQMRWKKSLKRKRGKYVNGYTYYVPGMYNETSNGYARDLKFSFNKYIKNICIPGFLKKAAYDIYDYDEVCRNILNEKYQENEYMGLFPGFDNTARRGQKSWIYEGSTPAKFRRYLSKVIEMSCRSNKDMIFITAWNEWGEGNYLEPDKKYGYAWLNAVKKARKDNE